MFIHMFILIISHITMRIVVIIIVHYYSKFFLKNSFHINCIIIIKLVLYTYYYHYYSYYHSYSKFEVRPLQRSTSVIRVVITD